MSISPMIVSTAADSFSSRFTAAQPLLVCLPSMTAETASAVMTELLGVFPSEAIVVASPDQDAERPAGDGLPHLIPYPEPRGNSAWVLDTQDYVSAARLAQQRGASSVLLLGSDVASLDPHALRTMQAGLAAGADLALPRYQTAADDGLVNSALLYPLTRALFGADIRFPLAVDAGLSSRMLLRLANTATRLRGQPESALLWPVAEACLAGFSVREVDGGPRTLPQPEEADLNELFPAVTSSLFADIEGKATYWQRARAVPAPSPAAPRAATDRGDIERREGNEEVRSLIDGYRIAFDNLREIWALVLPPQSLLALKKLSASTPETFVYPPNLWARTVYDFALAYHLRTLNRGHLLGALTPLYLAWVASFLRTSGGETKAGTDLLQITASAFEQEKPYLVSRWRWPDRFNP